MMSLRVIDSSFGSIRKTIRFSLSVPTARPSPEAFRLLSDSSERINTLGRRAAASYADSVRGEDRISGARMTPALPHLASDRHMPTWRDGESDMEDSQRRRVRDFVIFVIVAVFLLGVAGAGVARGAPPGGLIAVAPLRASVVVVGHPGGPPPPGRRGPVPPPAAPL